MARPVYPHELADPDFQWLMNTYREAHSNCSVVDVSLLPVVILPTSLVMQRLGESEGAATIPATPGTEISLDDLADEPEIS